MRETSAPKRGWRREALALIVSVTAVCLALAFLTRLLTPKQHDYGATWGHFLQEEPDSVDVLFLGSSMVYCDVVPAVFWQESGLSAYVCAGPEQTIPMSAHYLRQALKTQSPQVVFLELTGVFFGRYTGFTKTNIGQMPWGRERLAATFREAEPELRAGLLFPLYFYHDRWQELTSDDFRVALTGYGRDPMAGYTFLDEYDPGVAVHDRVFDQSEAAMENRRRNERVLAELCTLCREKGITPVFYVSPTMGRVPAALLEPLKTYAAGLDGALVLDCNEYFEEIGADPARDFYDDVHFNAAGAEKFSRFLARWLSDTLAPVPAAERDAALWQSRVEAFQSRAARPMREKN